jgi:hypothetical protein
MERIVAKMPDGREPPSRAVLHIISMMMTSERQIWKAAIVLVRRHGEDAAEVAERETAKHGQGDGELTYAVWRWIARATAELFKADRSAAALPMPRSPAISPRNTARQRSLSRLAGRRERAI